MDPISLFKPSSLAQAQGISQEKLPPPETKGIEEAAQSFESYFIQMLLKEMRKSVQKSDLFGPGMGKDLYDSMFDQAISKAMAKEGGMGLSKLLIERYGGEEKP